MIAVPWKAVGVLVLVLIGAASAWQFQDWRYEGHLAEQSRLHTETLNQLTMAAATAQQAEQDKRLALEQRLTVSEQTHFERMTDAQKNQDRLPLLICGSQSSSAQVQPVAVQCLPPPAPAAWIMQPYAPDLTQRMLNELSPSPTLVTGD